ncbi:hypothetical protein ABXT70_10295 [Candidatus Njordibacter sp. Uisw_039]|uniref:hypothetical protein n=1 Tax=Candidatus Njordibacter sp. Uisw_039 TaxID=3230972 RepID=UPI003D5C7F9F
MNTNSSTPDCMQCKHFYVTWEAKFPRGCRLFAIKSRQLPMIEIMRIDGHACRGYAPKPAPQPKDIP